MDLQNAIKESLQHLFEGYCSSGGTGVFSLDEIATRHGVEANALGKLLNDQGWINNPTFGAFEFSCQISRNGIQQIQPGYFHNLISQAIITAGMLNDWTGLMSSLSFEQKDYQRAHDLGKVFESSGLADVQYQSDDIYIKLTLTGLDRYQRENEGGFH